MSPLALNEISQNPDIASISGRSHGTTGAIIEDDNEQQLLLDEDKKNMSFSVITDADCTSTVTDATEVIGGSGAGYGPASSNESSFMYHDMTTTTVLRNLLDNPTTTEPLVSCTLPSNVITPSSIGISTSTTTTNFSNTITTTGVNVNVPIFKPTSANLPSMQHMASNYTSKTSPRRDSSPNVNTSKYYCSTVFCCIYFRCL